MKKILLASTSTVHGKPYLTYILPELKTFFQGINEIVFIPYARPSGLTHDEYTAIARKALAVLSIKVKGLHEFSNPKAAIEKAQGFFTGGGNSFVLLNTLYELDILEPLKNAILSGKPYFGTSAGSNICGPSIKNTNDMPIVYPPSFEALGLIPFNINPHYLDPDLDSKHMGETRETRIKEYQFFNDIPVIGIREGSWIEIFDDEIVVKGALPSRWFELGKEPIEIEPETIL